MQRIKAGIIGIGDRGVSFIRNFRDYQDLAEIAGIFDTNRPRMEAMARHYDFRQVPLHDSWETFTSSADYDLMIVTTPDDTHPEVVTRCLDAGYHVFVDKPLANTPEGLVRIMEAYDRSDHLLMMGFNLRYHNVIRKMKEIVQRGELGEIKVATCEHPERGIRYFRRWHKFRAKSGGLVIHKGCHQLDVLNWLVGSYPVEVYAQGNLAVFKGNKTVKGCHVCEDLPHCPYARRLDYRETEKLRDMYIAPAEIDGYTRNYCPISSDADVPDFYLVSIRYANGTRATYNEIHFCGFASSSWAFYGDKAALVCRGEQGQTVIGRTEHLTGETAAYTVRPGEGGHGGADPAMTLDLIMSVHRRKSLLPPPEAGVRSSAIGIAAMKSIDENRPVRIEELLPIEYLERAPDQDFRPDATMEGIGYQAGAEKKEKHL